MPASLNPFLYKIQLGNWLHEEHRHTRISDCRRLLSAKDKLPLAAREGQCFIIKWENWDAILLVNQTKLHYELILPPATGGNPRECWTDQPWALQNAKNIQMYKQFIMKINLAAALPYLNTFSLSHLAGTKKRAMQMTTHFVPQLRPFDDGKPADREGGMNDELHSTTLTFWRLMQD